MLGEVKKEFLKLLLVEIEREHPTDFKQVEYGGSPGSILSYMVQKSAVSGKVLVPLIPEVNDKNRGVYDG